jgi:hypothetical protein
MEPAGLTRSIQHAATDPFGDLRRTRSAAMFILYGLLLGLIVGLLLRGRVAGLAELRFRWAALAVLGLSVQLVLFSESVAAQVGSLGPPLYVASTALVLLAVLRNLRITGMLLVALGAVCNLAAIVANGGYMPTTRGALAVLGAAEGTTYSNSTVMAAPSLPFLTDIFAMPPAMPFANVFSVGDVLIGLGVVVVVVAAMRRPGAAGSSSAAGDTRQTA